MWSGELKIMICLWKEKNVEKESGIEDMLKGLSSSLKYKYSKILHQVTWDALLKKFTDLALNMLIFKLMYICFPANEA